MWRRAKCLRTKLWTRLPCNRTGASFGFMAPVCVRWSQWAMGDIPASVQMKQPHSIEIAEYVANHLSCLPTSLSWNGLHRALRCLMQWGNRFFKNQCFFVFFIPFIAECEFCHYNQHQGLSTCQEKHPKSLGNKHMDAKWCKCHGKTTLMSEMMNHGILAEHHFLQKFNGSETPGIHHRWWSIGTLQHEGRIDVSGRLGGGPSWPVWKQWYGST